MRTLPALFSSACEIAQAYDTYIRTYIYTYIRTYVHTCIHLFSCSLVEIWYNARFLCVIDSNTLKSLLLVYNRDVEFVAQLYSFSAHCALTTFELKVLKPV